MENKNTFNRVMIIIFAACAIIFTASFALSEYLEIKSINIQAISTWNACVQNSQLGDKAEEFCRTKCSENYMFKTPFNWDENADALNGTVE